MTKLFTTICLGLMVLPMFAQSSTTNTTFSDQEKRKAQEELQRIGDMFGVKKSAPVQTTAPQNAETTMAEVADKALTMVGSAVGTIAGIVQKVAPDVWEIMVRQQYAAAFGMLVGPTLFLFLDAIFVITIKKYWKKWSNYDNASYFGGDFLSDKGWRAVITSLIPGILALVFGGVLAYRIGDAIPMLINPKYYAVRDLLQILLK